MKELTQSRLKELLHYRPETGVFTWLVAPRRGVSAGSVAGSLDRLGYREIGIRGERYKAHRLAWLWMTGTWPPDEIDHRNGVPGDDKWENLRPATRSQNTHNSKPHGLSRFKGVHLCRWTGRWRAQGENNGKKYHLGRYDTEEAAAGAYAAFAAEHFPEFARLK